MTTILAIESSCDETSAAVISNGQLRSNIVATQVIHQKYGGVVPELASRAHQQHILPVVEKALEDAKVSKKTLMPSLLRVAQGFWGHYWSVLPLPKPWLWG